MCDLWVMVDYISLPGKSFIENEIIREEIEAASLDGKASTRIWRKSFFINHCDAHVFTRFVSFSCTENYFHTFHISPSKEIPKDTEIAVSIYFEVK